MRALRLEPPTHNQCERLKRRTRLTSAGGYARSIGDRGPWHPARCARHRPRERRLRDLLRGDLDRCRAVSAADLCPVAPHVHRGFAVRIGRRGRRRWQHLGRRSRGGVARVAQHPVRRAPLHDARRPRLETGSWLAFRHRRNDRDGDRSRRSAAEPLRILGHRGGAVRLLEYRDPDRRPGHAGDLGSQSLRSGRRTPGRLPRAPRSPTQSPRATRHRSGGRGHRDPRAAVRPGRRAVAHRGRVRRALRRLAGDAMIWTGVLVASAACYGLKLAGLSLLQRWLQNTRVQRTVPLIPVALLAALIGTQTFATGQHLVLDVRAAALAIAVVAVVLRAPFLVVVAVAAATAALLRLL